ncbi:MAG: ferritin [Porphyromonas sp.]|nr:ferritin [Porphyromonas sp.]
MIKKELLDKINAQIAFEYVSAFIYKRMSIDMAVAGWDGFAHWFHEQYHEEIGHAEDMINYVISRGEQPAIFDLKFDDLKFDGVVSYFEKAYDHEREVSKRIDEIVTLAVKEKDYATENFYRKYVDEQVEEEESVSAIVTRLQLTDSKAGHMIVDKELAAR